MKGFDLSAKGTCLARSVLLKYKSYKTVYNRIIFSISKSTNGKGYPTEVNPVSPHI